MSEERHSTAAEAEIISDPLALAEREVQNGLLQYKAVVEMVDYFLGRQPFKLRTSHLLTLHRIALTGISGYAGNFRPGPIEISQSKHEPPNAFLVPEEIEALCDYVNENWHRSPLHLASYVLWRLNWIHPFTDGNGRTSRAVSYLVLCVRLGYLLPGRLTIPDQIAEDKKPYYSALEHADQSFKDGKEVDLTPMKEMLQMMLAKQLVAVHEDSRLENK